MRTILRPFLVLGGLALVGAVASVGCSGCEDDCDPSRDPGCASGSGVADAAPPSCVPWESAVAVAESCGIFVSVSRTSNDPDDINGLGTKDSPYHRFSDALADARTLRKPIYACGETFKEAIRVPEGVTIYGGMNCTANDWRYPFMAQDGSTRKSVIATDSGKIPLKLVVNTSADPHSDAGLAPARLSDFVFRAASAELPSASSIAAVAAAISAELVRCEFYAGDGADGAAGETPTASVGSTTDPEDPGVVGNAGSPSCMGGGMGNPGGEAKVNPLCPTSIGGAGGRGLEDHGEAGLPGEPPAKGFGGGGIGAVEPDTCLSGNSGRAGEMGEPGGGSKKLGAIELAGYIGVAGSAGSPGLPGQGGGGGGGAKGALNCFGASGGSGGAGGCGGAGGGGGKPGGSSIAFVSLGASLTLTDVVLSAGDGGRGGDGGDGQLGGKGGLGGKSGAEAPGMGLLPSCPGGDGGQGGDGGKGGGGRGGHSLGMAYRQIEPILSGTTILVGKGGAGGKGADAAGAGASGLKASSQSFP